MTAKAVFLFDIQANFYYSFATLFEQWRCTHASSMCSGGSSYRWRFWGPNGSRREEASAADESPFEAKRETRSGRQIWTGDAGGSAAILQPGCELVAD